MKNELPLVCICVPTFNAASTVRDTLKSILAQTYPNLVIHVSDNASTDETVEIVEKIDDRRIVIHSYDVNVGAEGNFTRCIGLAEGKYTAIFHADDLYEPDMVAKQVGFLEGSAAAGAVFTEANIIDDTGNKIGEIRLPADLSSDNGLYEFPQMFKAVLQHANFFICPSVMIRTQVLQEEIKYWRGDLFKTSADLDLWFRILQRHPVGYLSEKLMLYRFSASQFSARVRLDTERADFFSVIDHYMAKEQVRSFLDSSDMKNYLRLERRNRVIRAANLFIKGFPDKANDLMPDLFSWDVLASAFRGKRGLFVLFVGFYIKLLIVFKMNSFGRKSLMYIKQVARN